MNPQQLKQLEQAATPGPWRLSRSEFIGIVRRWEEDGVIRYGRDVAEAFGPEMDEQFETDAALTCAMRNALPHLIELWEAAQGVIDWAYRARIVASEPGDLDRLRAALARLDDAEEEA